MTVRPMSSREGSGASRRETLRTQHHLVQARAHVGLSAIAAPSRCPLLGINRYAQDHPLHRKQIFVYSRWLVEYHDRLVL